MVDKNSEQYLKSRVESYCYESGNGSLSYEKKIQVSGNNGYSLSLLTNEL